MASGMLAQGRAAGIDIESLSIRTSGESTPRTIIMIKIILIITIMVDDRNFVLLLHQHQLVFTMGGIFLRRASFSPSSSPQSIPL